MRKYRIQIDNSSDKREINDPVTAGKNIRLVHKSQGRSVFLADDSPGKAANGEESFSQDSFDNSREFNGIPGAMASTPIPPPTIKRKSAMDSLTFPKNDDFLRNSASVKLFGSQKATVQDTMHAKVSLSDYPNQI
jgi:hypothetical protein